MRKIILVLFIFLISCTNLNDIYTLNNEKSYNENNYHSINENNYHNINEKLKLEKENKEKDIIVKVKITELSKKRVNIEGNDIYINGEKIIGNNTIYIANNKINFNSRLYNEIYIINKGVINIEKFSFKGDILIRNNKNNLEIINIIDIEEYLKGVLPYETYTSFPLEALKAQAIISRTFVIKKIETSKKDYHVDNTTKFQVYRGIPKKNIDNMIKAINETKGLIIKYNDKPIDAIFHAYSGGITASANEVYGGNYPYLLSKIDKFSKGVPKNITNWKYEINRKKFEKELGFEISDIKYKISSTNRVINLTFISSDNKKKTYRGRDFRSKYSHSGIKSTIFTIKITPTKLIVSGTGYGHGVGFSQWSSKSMAEDFNMNYLDIIKYFYTDVKIEMR